MTLAGRLLRASDVGLHIWNHLLAEIEIDCYIGDDRRVYSNSRKYSLGEHPVRGLYVHPKTGVIRDQRI